MPRDNRRGQPVDHRCDATSKDAHMDQQAETIFGERGIETAHRISQLATRAALPGQLGSNFSIGPGGSIRVRFDEQSLAVFANPQAHSG